MLFTTSTAYSLKAPYVRDPEKRTIHGGRLAGHNRRRGQGNGTYCYKLRHARMSSRVRYGKSARTSSCVIRAAS